jgi:hypothetical protein
MRADLRVTLRIAALAMTLAVIADSPAHAQAGDTLACAPEPARADSLVRRPPDSWGLALVMGAFFAAPPSLLLLPEVRCLEPGRLGFWRNGVSASVGAGGVFRHGPDKAAHSVNFELFLEGVYGEVRLERQYHDDQVQLRTGRVGYLVHPVSSLAGGVTLGYRNAEGAPAEWAQSGVEIGFPLFIACRSSGRCWISWETSYLLSGEHPVVIPRVRGSFPVARTPLFIGFDAEARGLSEGDPAVVTLRLGLRP